MKCGWWCGVGGVVGEVCEMWLAWLVKVVGVGLCKCGFVSWLFKI